MNETVYKSYEDDKYHLAIVCDDYPESPREWDNLGTMSCGHRRYKLGDEQVDPSNDYASWDAWLKGEVLSKHKKDEVVYLPLYMLDHSGLTIGTSSFHDPWDSGQIGWIWATKQRFRDETMYNEEELFGKDKHRTPQKGDHVKVKGYQLHGCEGWGQVTDIRVAQDGIKFVVDFDYNKGMDFRKVENIVSVPETDILEVMSNRAEELLEGEVETYDQYLRGDVYGFVLEEIVKCKECGHKEYEVIDSCSGFYGDEGIEDMKEHVASECRYLFDHLA